MDLGLKDKTVLITGASNPMGIGAAAARAFCGEGAKIGLIYKKVKHNYNLQKIDEMGMDWYKAQVGNYPSELESLLQQHNCKFVIIEADISNEKEIPRIYNEVEKKLGPVNILINNAALYAEEDNILTVTGTAFEEVFAVNVKGAMLMIQEFVLRHQAREAHNGRIINLSTDAAQIIASQVIYVSSKAALESMTRTTALDVAHLGITVNSVAPGPIQTGWLDAISEQALLPTIPMGRVGTSKDIADVILFLASERASWLTGQIIKVDGGHAL